MIAWLRQHRDALRLALRRMAAAPVNSSLSLFAIGIALALPAGGYTLLANLQAALGKVSAKPQISVFMSVDADRKQVREIAIRLSALDGVESHLLVPREETLARMKNARGIGEVLDAIPGNPFPDTLVITPRDERPHALEHLAAELRRLPKVDHVQLDSAWVQRLDALLRLVRTALLMLAALLGAGLVAITFGAIRQQVTTSRAEIDVSRLLGATEAFVKRPYYYFGALLGLFGGALAWAIVSGGLAWLSGPISDLAQLYRLDFQLTRASASDALGLLSLSSALGWIGAALSLHRS